MKYLKTLLIIIGLNISLAVAALYNIITPPGYDPTKEYKPVAPWYDPNRTLEKIIVANQNAIIQAQLKAITLAKRATSLEERKELANPKGRAYTGISAELKRVLGNIKESDKTVLAAKDNLKQAKDNLAAQEKTDGAKYSDLVQSPSQFEFLGFYADVLVTTVNLFNHDYARNSIEGVVIKANRGRQQDDNRYDTEGTDNEIRNAVYRLRDEAEVQLKGSISKYIDKHIPALGYNVKRLIERIVITDGLKKIKVNTSDFFVSTGGIIRDTDKSNGYRNVFVDSIDNLFTPAKIENLRKEMAVYNESEHESEKTLHGILRRTIYK